MTADEHNNAAASRTIMIMAGGTGGHIFPALAVADYLRERGWRVIWVGAKAGMEATLVPQRGYEMAWVRLSGVRGKGPVRALTLPFELLAAFWQSVAAIRRHRPRVVLGMGGYVAFPGGMMASLLGKPLVIHEQNSVAGLTNRLLAQVADKVLVAFPGAFGAREAVVTGNPVRSEIAAVEQPDRRFAGRAGPLRLLVLGGSLGAQALNETVPRAIALIAGPDRPLVTHQSGAAHIDALARDYAEAGVRAELVSFIDDMAARYAASDLVVCRAGAITLAELACAGVASVLVPFPHAVDDHQTRNARFLAERGAALLIPQHELTAAGLADVLRGFTRARALEMARRARELAKPGATRDVAEACIRLAA